MSRRGFVIPTLGFNRLTSLLAEETLEITRVMFGSGKLDDSIDPSTVTDLVQPVGVGTSTIPITKGNVCSFVLEFRNDLNGGLEDATWLQEFAVWARTTNMGETLIYYGMLGDFPQPLSPFTGGAIDVRRFPIAITLTQDVKVVLDYPSIAFMTAEDVDEYFRSILLPIALNDAARLIAAHNIAPDAHQDIRAKLNLADGRIGRLEEMFIFNITANSFLVGFGDLTDLVVTGVWNQAAERVEF